MLKFYQFLWILLTLLILLQKPTGVTADVKNFPKKLTIAEKVLLAIIIILAIILIILIIAFVVKQCISRKTETLATHGTTVHPEAPPETSLLDSHSPHARPPVAPPPEAPPNLPPPPRPPQSAEPAIPTPEVSMDNPSQKPDPDEELVSARGSSASKKKSKKSKKSRKSKKQKSKSKTKSDKEEKPQNEDSQLPLESCKDAPSVEVTLRNGLPPGVEATKDDTLDDEALKTTREDEITGIPTQKLAIPKCTLYKVNPQIEDAWSVLEYIKNNRIVVKGPRAGDSEVEMGQDFDHPDCKKLIDSLQKTYENKSFTHVDPAEVATHSRFVLVCVNQLGKLSKQSEFEATKRKSKFNKDNELVISSETRAWLQEPHTSTIQRHTIYALELKHIFTFGSSSLSMKEKLTQYPISILYFYVIRNDVPLWIRIQALEIMRLKVLPFLYAPVAIIMALPHPIQAVMMAVQENPHIINEEKWFLYNESTGSVDQQQKHSKSKSVCHDPNDPKNKKSKHSEVEAKEKKLVKADK